MASDGRRDLIQDDALRPLSRRRASTQPHSRKSKNKPHSRKSSAAVDSPPDDKPSDLEALRKARLAYIKTPPEGRPKKMKYVGETVTREPAKKADLQHIRKVSGTRRRRKRSDVDKKHHHRNTRVDEIDAGGYRSVYERDNRQRGVESTIVDVEENETEEVNNSDAQSNEASDTTQKGKVRCSEINTPIPKRRENVVVEKPRRSSRRRQSEPIKRINHIRRNSYGIDECPPPSKQRKTPARQSPPTSPPSLQRSTTILRSRSEAIQTAKPSPIRSKTAPSIVESHVKKGSSLFSSLLRPSPATQLGLKRVTCLTCGSDDTPIVKTAKLACTHRMCHDCLRRIFTMSVTDPAHMPPKCCTSEHIPLKHVDKLFDQKFKKSWNRKFQEYTTRNRIYCPTRHCGEWIKPNHITLEHGRKVGKCKRCGTRVCCTCNNKMHTSRECPKDPATKMFVEVAKQEGWQRCFNCSAMVELKEGCNHMTCRCTAEFCMICGNKWKTCDCPWFNYEAVEADRLQHMNFAQGRRMNGNEDAQAPIRYQEEVDRRRHQERRDEALARRMQMLGLDDDPSDDVTGEDDPGHVFGLGNAADHFLNHDFRQRARNILTGNFRQAARAAEGLLNGAVTGRENPLPPAPFELNAPAANAANQTAQLLNHDSASNAALNNVARRRSNDQGNPRRRGGNQAQSRGAIDPAEVTVPLPATLPHLTRRPTLFGDGQARGASALGGLLGGRSQTEDERAAELRIENWRSEVPVGQPADGVMPV